MLSFERWRIAVAVAVAVAVVFTVLHGRSAIAAPPTPQRVLELCANVEGSAHCARLVEAEQLKTLPSLAVRDGDTLHVSLFPAGNRDLVDVDMLDGSRTYALWDYWSPVNAVVLFTTDRQRLGYALLQRATGQLSSLPGEPVLAPDRQRLVIADFCATGCENEISVWRVGRNGVVRELAWKPGSVWTDVTAVWKESDALNIEYTIAGESAPRKIERKLAEPGWRTF